MTTKRTQPWLDLYNMDSRIGTNLPPIHRKAGRPRSALQRDTYAARLTSEEGKSLRSIEGRLIKQLAPATVTQAQVFGFAVRLLDFALENTPEINESTDWKELWDGISQKLAEK